MDALDPSAFDIINKIFTSLDKGVSIAGKLKSLIGTPKSEHDREFVSLISTLYSEIGDAKLANADLKVHISKLTNELLAAQKTQDKFRDYEIYQTPYGAFVYRFKKATNSDTPEHFLCPYCKDKGKRTILQPSDYSATLFCRPCNLRFVVSEEGVPGEDV